MPLTRSRLYGALALSATLTLTGLIAGCNPPAPTPEATASAGSPSASGSPSEAAAGGDKLVIAWAKWTPADQLQKLVADYTKETGTTVEVQQIPWSDFENKVKLAWSSQSPDYDLVIGDSQWLGKASTAGHYVDLTDWSKTNVPMADMAKSAVTEYGEYPAGSGKLWGLPCEEDALAFAYRKDLFDDAKNKAAFKAKYGKELAPPDTWEDFQHVAEFFTQPDKKLYGAALFYAKQYDGVTMGFDSVLWGFGGKLSDPSGKKIDGVLNDATGVKALQFYTDLKKFTPPGSENFYFDECLRAFQQGQVAMAESWFAFLPDLNDAAKNKYKGQTGYFMVPKGPAGRFVQLGGQGISISAYSKKQDAAKKFLSWFEKEDTQKKWVALGGLTANTKVAATDAFKNAAPYNAVFASSVPFLKDFYNTPDYSELLSSAQKNLNAAVAGAMSPKEALDTLAKEQQKVVDAAK